MEERSEQLLGKIKPSKHLPSLPQILLKMIDLCRYEEADLIDISQIVAVDPSMCVKFMQIAHSACPGQFNRVKNIDQALVRIGRNAVENIVHNASILQALNKETPTSVSEIKPFWTHSLMCAVLSKLIAQKISYPSPEEAYFTGLLHDIGKLVMRVNFPKEHADILKPPKDQKDRHSEEEARRNIMHCEVGAWLIRRWNLQSFIVDAIRYHHETVDRIKNALSLVKIIYAGNLLCPETRTEKDVKIEIAKSIFGFKISEVEEIIRTAERGVSDIAQSLGIDIHTLDTSEEAFSEKEHETQKELIREVRDFTLLQHAFQKMPEAQDEDAILKDVVQGFNILFDIKHVLFFLYQSGRNALLGRGVALHKKDDPINDVSILCQKEKSIIVESFLRNTPLDSFSDSVQKDITIIDEQIIRLMGSDGIFCLPMITREQYIGVVVLGLEKTGVTHLYEKKKLLTRYAKQAAVALHAHSLRRNQRKTARPKPSKTTAFLAQRVVHEAKTPLSIIRNYLAVLERKLSESGVAREEIKIINEEIDRVALLLDEISDLSEHKIHPKDPLELNSFLSDLIKIFQESLLLKPGIHVHLMFDSSIPPVMTDKNRIRRVFNNIIKNATEAMPDGGNLYISTRYNSKPFRTGINPNRNSEIQHVEIIVRDDGPGIVETVKSNLFEPHVSSKGKGHAGLGLSIVYDTLKELKGTITCESDGQSGTSFKIVLPVTQDS